MLGVGCALGETVQESRETTGAREASGVTDRRAAAARTWLNFLSHKPGQKQQSKSSLQSTSPSSQEQRLLPARTQLRLLLLFAQGHTGSAPLCKLVGGEFGPDPL
ncbi:protein FAM196B [Platysternon megacephalum]|uniref:Protein FAM196B n=1 Tax=Platysternon megacephalum TaxID=55544 RepID=A0A4D9DY93_9SAUR|nr:protein FAM196B [Platysternon megacephalum]